MIENREAQIVELLNESETYMEKNMNAAVNNMSVLTLHSFELANHLDLQKKDQISQEKIVRNMEALASFASKKSGDMRLRLERAASRFGYHSQIKQEGTYRA